MIYDNRTRSVEQWLSVMTLYGPVRPLDVMEALEAENIELKAKVKELEKRLERFGELSETLSEMGLMPR